MSEFDPRFGRPRHVNNSADELAHASDEAFSEMTKNYSNMMKQGFRSVFEGMEKCSDELVRDLGSREDGLKHSQEIEAVAQKEAREGHIDAAKYEFKRDLMFSEQKLGFNDDQTESLRWQLHLLDDTTESPSASANERKINSFEDLFRLH